MPPISLDNITSLNRKRGCNLNLWRSTSRGHPRAPPFSGSSISLFHSRSNPAVSGTGPPSTSISASAALNSRSRSSSELWYKRCNRSSTGCFIFFSPLSFVCHYLVAILSYFRDILNILMSPISGNYEGVCPCHGFYKMYQWVVIYKISEWQKA